GKRCALLVVKHTLPSPATEAVNYPASGSEYCCLLVRASEYVKTPCSVYPYRSASPAPPRALIIGERPARQHSVLAHTGPVLARMAWAAWPSRPDPLRHCRRAAQKRLAHGGEAVPRLFIPKDGNGVETHLSV